VFSKFFEGQSNVIDLSKSEFLSVLDPLFRSFYSGRFIVMDSLMGQLWRAMIYFQVEDDILFRLQDVILEKIEFVELTHFHEIASFIVSYQGKSEFVEEVINTLFRRSIQDNFFDEFDYADEDLNWKVTEHVSKYKIAGKEISVRSDLVFKANSLESAECYDMMVDTMKQLLVLSDHQLYEDERNLFSRACRNFIGQMRAGWRMLNALLDESDEHKSLLINTLKSPLKKKMLKFINEILENIDTLIKKSSPQDSRTMVFWYKMQGDYYRFTCELETGDPFEVAKGNGFSSYAKGMEIGGLLPPTNPIYLGLCLNFSVFHYEIRRDALTACTLAKNTFDTALGILEQLPDEEYKDATLILQLIRDNLTFWTTEGNEVNGVESIL